MSKMFAQLKSAMSTAGAAVKNVTATALDGAADFRACPAASTTRQGGAARAKLPT